MLMSDNFRAIVTRQKELLKFLVGVLIIDTDKAVQAAQTWVQWYMLVPSLLPVVLKLHP